MIGTDLLLDAPALLGAERTAKIAIVLAWREHFNLTNRPSLRDEWARAFSRHLLHYIDTTRPN